MHCPGIEVVAVIALSAQRIDIDDIRGQRLRHQFSPVILHVSHLPLPMLLDGSQESIDTMQKQS